MTVISQSLLVEYNAAEYHVNAVTPFILKIGIFSPELVRLYRKAGLDCAAFITAYNPGSQAFSDKANQARNKALQAQIETMHYQYLLGAGKCADDEGTGEISLLILGINLATASNIGKQFEQNAIVWCDSNAIPQLILLK